MRILFAHLHFPGQFTQLARSLLAEGHDIVALSGPASDGRASEPVKGVRVIEIGGPVRRDRPSGHVLAEPEHFIRMAGHAAMMAETLRDNGFVPDIIISHAGWGVGAFLHAVFPATPKILYCEWFIDYGPDRVLSIADGMRNDLINLPMLAELGHAKALIAPTRWQKSRFPSMIRDRIDVVPDGFDLQLLARDPSTGITLPDGRKLDRSQRIVTYVARGAEPLRGFDTFIAALGKAQGDDPDLHAIILGDQLIYYGDGHGSDSHFRAVMAKARFDPHRTHFLGRVPHDTFRRVLHVSSAHVYLTGPFVLSWSFMEAMAAGAPIIGSDTEPVREFLSHGRNGLLTGFADADALADKMVALANDTALGNRLGDAARQTIRERASLDVSMACYHALFNRVLAQASSR